MNTLLKQVLDEAAKLCIGKMTLVTPGLSFKKIHAARPVWSVRIGLDHRAVGVIEADVISWFG